MFFEKLYIKYTSEKIAEDEFGNTYYLSKKQDYFGRKKRYVIYKGQPEPSKIPPMWHAWIHYLTNEIPDESRSKIHKWQKEHLPNLTGTTNAYKPVRVEVSADYESWKPEK